MADAHRNFAKSAVLTAPSPPDSGLSLTITAFHGGHPNLLEAYFEDDPKASALASAHVRKPLFSREGANISIVEPGGTELGFDGGYDGRAILQAVHAPPVFDGRYAIVGSWVAGDEPAGMSVREDEGRITRNVSRFVPHFIRD